MSFASRAVSTYHQASLDAVGNLVINGAAIGVLPFPQINAFLKVASLNAVCWCLVYCGSNGHGYVVSSSAPGVLATDLGVYNGDQSVAIGAAGAGYVASIVQAGGASIAVQPLNADGTVNGKAATAPVSNYLPQQTTSQGFASIDTNGVPTFYDPDVPRQVGPFSLAQPKTSGTWTAGFDENSTAILAWDGQRGWTCGSSGGAQFPLDVALQPDGTCLIAISGDVSDSGFRNSSSF